MITTLYIALSAFTADLKDAKRRITSTLTLYGFQCSRAEVLADDQGNFVRAEVICCTKDDRQPLFELAKALRVTSFERAVAVAA